MLKGINLTLMIGPAVPLPVSQEVLDALTSVEVTSNTEGPSVFQLGFTLSARSPLHTLFLLSGGASIPLVRVVIVVTLGGTPHVLMDGVMTRHDIRPGQRAGEAVLTVTGEDLSRVMTYVDFDGTPFPGMPPEARVLLILAKYAAFGILPVVIPSVLVDVPIPVERIPRQQGTDLEYVTQLAEEVGYVFYVDPGPVPGTSTAYWGPEVKVGPPQPALSTGMDAHTNVDSLSFGIDPQKNVLPVLIIQNRQTKAPIPIPVPDITPLNPPLGAVRPLPTGLKFISGLAKYNPLQAALIGLAKAAKFSEAVSGQGSLDVLRYRHVLKARQLVGVRGAGIAFDGLHFVRSVKHAIKRGEYKQDFTLSRNGLVSTLPRVPA
ncbi:hypothetical protein ACFQX4_19300 [Roseomonas sp. GCM10028921]